MQEQEGLRPLLDSQQEALEEAVARYAAALDLDPATGLYLQDRGIETETAATFRLGVVDDPAPGHGWHKGKLAIPYLDRHGMPLTVRFRCLEKHDCRSLNHGKYMSITDDPSRMYNIRAIHEADDEIHLTEGELDAIILNQIGFHAVATPGAKGFQGRHRRMLAGFSRVWVWGDPDDAGAEFVNKVTRMLRSAKGVQLRDGDVTETYLAGDRNPEALTGLIN